MDEPQRTECQFRISLALPWLLKLPDSTYEGRHGRNQYRLVTKAHVTSVGNAVGEGASVMFHAMSGQLTRATGAQVPGAMLRYTEVVIDFFKKIAGSAVSQDDRKRVITIACRCLNHFLDAYRFVAKDFEVRPLSPKEFHETRGGRGLKVQSNMKRSNGHGTLTSGVFFDEKNPVILGGTTSIADAAVDELREHLRAGHTPPLSPLLLLNAEMYLQTGQTRMAVIDASAALDVIVEQIAQMWLLRNGELLTDVDRKLEKMNTVVIMKDILLPNLEIPVDSDFPWENWCKKYRVLRNRVVHDAYEPSPDETQECFDNISRLCKFIGSLQIGTKD